MDKINIPALILSFIVVLFFVLVGVALSYQNFLWVTVCLLLGFLVMGFGIYLKIKRQSKES